jgi:hypothetical protein
MTIFPVELFDKTVVSFFSPRRGAAAHPARRHPRASKGKKNEDPARESSFNRYREIGAPELAQRALGALFRPCDLDLPALHDEHILRAVGHADLATLAPLEVDFYDRLFLLCSLAFSHPDHIRSGLFHATKAMNPEREKPRSKLE